MESLIEVFHVDIKLLVAQMVNFAIVISVLYFFALKPLLATMQERTKKIEKSLLDADEIQTKLKKAEDEYEKKLIAAKKEASNIIEKANLANEEKREKMMKKAKEEIGAIINDEREKMRQEKAQVLKEIKSEMSVLVLRAVEKVLDKKMNEKEDKEFIKKIIK